MRLLSSFLDTGFGGTEMEGLMLGTPVRLSRLTPPSRAGVRAAQVPFRE
jgi:hypothetical protein